MLKALQSHLLVPCCCRSCSEDAGLFRNHSHAAMQAPGLRRPPRTAAVSCPAPPGTAAAGAPGAGAGSKEHVDVRARAKSGRTQEV